MFAFHLQQFYLKIFCYAQLDPNQMFSSVIAQKKKFLLIYIQNKSTFFICLTTLN